MSKTIPDEVYEEFIKEVTGLKVVDMRPIDVVAELTRAVRRAANTVIVRNYGEDDYLQDLKDRGLA